MLKLIYSYVRENRSDLRKPDQVHDLRGNQGIQFSLPENNVVVFSKSVFYHGFKLWNEISDDIRNSVTANQFGSKILNLYKEKFNEHNAI